MSRSHVRNYFPEIYSNTIVAFSANWLMSEIIAFRRPWSWPITSIRRFARKNFDQRIFMFCIYFYILCIYKSKYFIQDESRKQRIGLKISIKTTYKIFITWAKELFLSKTISKIFSVFRNHPTKTRF